MVYTNISKDKQSFSNHPPISFNLPTDHIEYTDDDDHRFLLLCCQQQ